MLINTSITEEEFNILFAKARECADRDDPYWTAVYNGLNYVFGGGEHPDHFADDDEQDMMPAFARPGYRTAESAAAVRILSTHD
jgi:hypothetical protein